MGWLDNYRQASFRNVNFFVRSHDFSGGRRKTKFQYPGSDRIDFQDHGKNGKDFSIRAYIIGDNYYSDRNDLIDALDKKGSGKLVHPYLGILTVEAGEYSVSERSEEGRMVRMVLNFLEVSLDVRTVETINSQIKVFNAREAALLAIDEAFRKTYSVVRKPFSVINNVQETIGVGFTAINNAKLVYQAVPEFQDEVERAINDVPTLFRDVNELSVKTLELLTFGTGLTGTQKATEDNSRKMFDDFLSLFGFTPVKTLPGENDPAQIFSQSLDYSTVSVAGSLLSVIDFTNYNDAIELRNLLFKEIDRILLIEDLDEIIYEKLLDLRTEIFNDIESRITDLSGTSVVVLTEFSPAAVLSFQLYGTKDNEQSIIDRNNVSNPGFLPVNVPIEVETIV